MTIQDLIHRIGKWLYSNELAKFDQDREELTKGRQFPDEKAISKRLDFVMSSFDGNKISLGTTTTEEDIAVIGADNNDQTE
jgi:hypothetical protein